MNDRFKFRVWDKRNKRHIYEIERTYDSNNESGAWSFAEVLEDDNFIVEQCTGLRDKNGCLIYEGDIVRQTTTNRTCRIVFFRGAFCGEFCGWYSKAYASPISQWLRSELDEVIGNIHGIRS